MAQVIPARHVLEVALRINGVEHRLAIEPRVTLLDALREYLDLVSRKKEALKAAAASKYSPKK